MYKLFIILYFIFIAVWGINLTMLGMGNEMAGCPFMNNLAVICRMNAMEHLAGWQSIFIALTVFLAFLIINFNFQKILPKENILIFSSQKFLNFCSNILLAFIKGILHSKVY